MISDVQKLMARDCHQQFRSIRRLLLQLQDDLGDLAANARGEATLRAELEALSDWVVEVETRAQAAQDRLSALSYKGV